MKRFYGGEKVPKGVYVKLATWEITQAYEEAPVLPGGRETGYIKIPGALAVIAGPFAGLAFIIFLPFAGIAGLLSFIAYRVGQWTSVVGQRVFQPVLLGRRPGRAYLTQREGKGRRRTEDVEDKELTGMTINEIADEIARRRQRGEK